MTGASRQLGRHQNVEDHGLYSSDAPASTQVLDASVMLFSITPVGVIRHLWRIPSFVAKSSTRILSPALTNSTNSGTQRNWSDLGALGRSRRGDRWKPPVRL